MLKLGGYGIFPGLMSCNERFKFAEACVGQATLREREREYKRGPIGSVFCQLPHSGPETFGTSTKTAKRNKEQIVP